MIDKLLILVVLVSFSTVITAQEEKTRFGAKAGVNFASLVGDGTDNLDGITRFHFGALVEIPIEKKLSYQLELVYSSQGYKLNTTTFSIFFGILAVENKIKLDYIHVPLTAKYYIFKGLNVQLGPQIGLLVSAKTEANSAGFTTEIDTDELYTTLDFGLNFGGGYQFDMGVFVDARYNLGLSNINKDPRFQFTTNETKNSVMQLSVGYKF